MNTPKTLFLPEKPILLVGMMGCGKSAIGALLAKTLNVPFIDTDTCIEEKYGMSISHIFEMYGEAYFRKKEYETIQQLLIGENKVIAVGGGAFIQDPVRELIKKYAISMWIHADYEVLLERLSRKTHRPLLETGDKAAIIKDLINKRYPTYAQADITVETTTGAHEVVVKRILDQFKY